MIIRFVTEDVIINVISGVDKRRDSFIAKTINGKFVSCSNEDGEAFTHDHLTLWGAICEVTMPELTNKKDMNY